MVGIECEHCRIQEIKGSRMVTVNYVEELDAHICGECEKKHDDGVEEYEERRRTKLQEQNQY